MKLSKYLRLLVFSFLPTTEILTKITKLSQQERMTVATSNMLLRKDRQIVFTVTDNSDLSETIYLQKIFNKLVLNLANLASYARLGDQLKHLSSSFKLIINFSTPDLPIEQLNAHAIHSLEIYASHPQYFSPLSTNLVNLSNNELTVRLGKWLINSAPKIKTLCCYDSDVRLTQKMHLKNLIIVDSDVYSLHSLSL